MILDRNRYSVLYVDDEPHNLVAFRYAMEDQFNVLTAGTAEQALELLKRDEVVVLVADQRMPGTSGVELCVQARMNRPDVVRMIATAYADIHEAIEAINRGYVARYIVKPWRNEELMQVLQTAIDFAHVQRTMQDMEMRLLQVGQARAAVAAQDELVHEIRNPLTIVKCAIDRSLELVEQLERLGRDTQSPAHAKLLEVLEEQQGAMRALGHIEAVTSRLHSKPSRTNVEKRLCDAARVVDSTVRIVRRQVERLTALELELEEVPPVALEASALGQIVLNLIMNASQAIQERGMTGRTIRVSLALEDDEAVLAVTDDGPGIPPAVLPKIFDAYVTTRTEGNGVGLAVVRDIAMRVGGSVRARNGLKGGARLEVRLPCVLPEPSGDERAH
jgi:signal transduction histidine kinase